MEEDEEDFFDVVTFNKDEDFLFDEKNVLKGRKRMHVSRNTFRMLQCSRYSKDFIFEEGKHHVGIFDKKCFPFETEEKDSSQKGKGGCCGKQQSCCGKKKQCCC